MATPTATRPYIAHREYGIPRDKKGLLNWADVAERFNHEQNFWICTASAAGKPHVRPTWGVLVGDTIFFGGGPKTRWSRNLADNPQVSVHLESGSNVVIAEGTVGRITDSNDPRLVAADDVYETKYKMRHGPPMWVLKPVLVLAWNNFPKDCTRFTF